MTETSLKIIPVEVPSELANAFRQLERVQKARGDLIMLEAHLDLALVDLARYSTNHKDNEELSLKLHDAMGAISASRWVLYNVEDVAKFDEMMIEIGCMMQGKTQTP